MFVFFEVYHIQPAISLVDPQSLFSMKISVDQQDQDGENTAHPSKSNPFTKPRDCKQYPVTDQMGHVSPKKHLNAFIVISHKINTVPHDLFLKDHTQAWPERSKELNMLIQEKISEVKHSVNNNNAHNDKAKISTVP